MQTRVLVTGGGSSWPSGYPQVSRYEPVTATWLQIANTAATWGHWKGGMVELLDHRIVLLFGQDAYNSYVLSEVFDPETGAWTNLPASSAYYADPGYCLLPNGRVLVAGGYWGGQLLTSEELIPTEEGFTWSSTGNMQWGRYQHKLAVMGDGSVLAVGGRGDYDAPQYTRGYYERYDPKTRTWTSLGYLSATARVGHTLTRLLSGEILLVGGYNASDGLFNTTYIFNPITLQWRQVTSSPLTRAFHTATVLADGRVFIAGGARLQSSWTPSEGRETCNIYDPINDIWTAAASMSYQREQHCAVRLGNGKILIVSGAHGSGTSEVYDPATNTWAAAVGMSTAPSAPMMTNETNDPAIAGGLVTRLGQTMVAKEAIQINAIRPYPTAYPSATSTPNQPPSTIQSIGDPNSLLEVEGQLEVVQLARLFGGVSSYRAVHAAAIDWGLLVYAVNASGVKGVAKADAASSGLQNYVVGVCGRGNGAGLRSPIVTAGVYWVQLNAAPAVGDVGKVVYLSGTAGSGLGTLTAPTVAVPVGILVSSVRFPTGGVDAYPVALQLPALPSSSADPTLLGSYIVDGWYTLTKGLLVYSYYNAAMHGSQTGFCVAPAERSVVGGYPNLNHVIGVTIDVSVAGGGTVKVADRGIQKVAIDFTPTNADLGRPVYLAYSPGNCSLTRPTPSSTTVAYRIGYLMSLDDGSYKANVALSFGEEFPPQP